MQLLASTLLVLSLVNPVSGPIGTSVTAGGTSFTGARTVDLGTAAASFTVNRRNHHGRHRPGAHGPRERHHRHAIPSPMSGGWQLNGSAQLITTPSPANLQLTSATNWQAGSAFYPAPVAGVGISAAFDAFIGSGSGADGLTFTLADARVSQPTALGVNGGGEGFSGITGIAVSLDTWQNAVNPSSNFVGIAIGAIPGAANELNYVTTNSSIPSLQNAVHHFVVTTSSTGITVTMDGTQVLSDKASLPPSVLVGFTGGTGGFNDIHQVQNVVIDTRSPPPAPTVTALRPTSGLITGGTKVSITGRNFSGATAVDFGTTAATFRVKNSTTISAIAPGGTGTVDVTVTTGNGTSVTRAADQFTYIVGPPPPPIITLVNPVSGPAGTLVTVSGSNFTGATAIDFGPTAATFTVNSSTIVTAIAPAGTGTVDVTLTTPEGRSATSTADQFTYTTGVSPIWPPRPWRGDGS